MMVVDSRKFKVNGFKDGRWSIRRKGTSDEVLIASVKYVSGDIVIFLKANGEVEPSYASHARGLKDLEIQSRITAVVDSILSRVKTYS